MCGPCQFMVPILNEVSATLIEKIQVVKIDTEKYPNLANKYQIEALPTFILIKDGEPRDHFFNKQEDDGEVLARIRYGASAMAKARRMRDGLDVEVVGEYEVEETLLCVVLANAVEVQVNRGPGVGIAVYDVEFSWIKHSCSPNAGYRFSMQESFSGGSQILIVPASHDEVEKTKYIDLNEFEQKREGEKHGPRIVVRSIKAVDKGDEVFVAYTDLLQPKVF